MGYKNTGFDIILLLGAHKGISFTNWMELRQKFVLLSVSCSSVTKGSNSVFLLFLILFGPHSCYGFRICFSFVVVDCFG